MLPRTASPPPTPLPRPTLPRSLIALFLRMQGKPPNSVRTRSFSFFFPALLEEVIAEGLETFDNAGRDFSIRHGR